MTCDCSNPGNFSRLTTTFYRAIKTVNEKNYLGAGSGLYDLLLRPSKKYLAGKNRLLIIPDGILYYMPFEAFIANDPPKESKAVDFTKLNYLINRYEISYSYSATFYLNRLRHKNIADVEHLSFIGFAPVFRDVDSNGVMLTNNALAFKKDPAALRAITVDGKRFAELRYSEREVSLIAENFQKKGRTGASFLYDNATEENFKSNIGRYSCVHIATHGYINEEHPELSMLSLFPTAEHDNDRRRGALCKRDVQSNVERELARVKQLRKRTGKVSERRRGYGDHPRVLLFRTQNIIFSLWKVYDRQTNELMTEFYSNVLEGETFSSALRKSKLRLIADRTTAFPSKWSGFILVGE